jgi:hypothetical protein
VQVEDDPDRLIKFTKRFALVGQSGNLPDIRRCAGCYVNLAGEEISMSRFVVRFMKDVLGDNGCEREVCQSTVEIDALDEGQAAELAKRKFCELQALPNWWLHADRVKIDAADFAS